MKKYNPQEPTTQDDFLSKRLKSLLMSSLKHITGYLEQVDAFDIYVCFYEQLINNLDLELRKILDYLDLDLDRASFNNIISESSFQKMNRESPNHVRIGETMQWARELSADQKKISLKLLSPLLNYLKYPLKATQDQSSQPRLSRPVDINEISRLKKHVHQQDIILKFRLLIKTIISPPL
jgi:hypothetical protein